MAQDEQQATYSVEQAAKILGIGRNTAYEAANSGEIPTIRIGRRVLVPKVWLDALLNGGNTPARLAESGT
jgi:excisionase family DNA binding protein